MLIAYFFSLQAREFTASTLYFVAKLFLDQIELPTAKKNPGLFELMLIRDRRNITNKPWFMNRARKVSFDLHRLACRF